MKGQRRTTGILHRMADYDTFALGDFPLQSAATLWQAQLAYKTYGTLSAAGDNVVLIPTFYASQHTDCELMFAPGRAIDPAKHFIVVVNMFGNGLSSSPSNAPEPGVLGRVLPAEGPKQSADHALDLVERRYRRQRTLQRRLQGGTRRNQGEGLCHAGPD